MMSEPRDIVPEAAPPPPARRLWPAAAIIGFLLLAAGEGALYWLQQRMPDHSTAIAVLQAQVASLQQFAMRAVPAQDSISVQANLAQKLAQLDAQVTALLKQAAADHATVTMLAASNLEVSKLTARMTLVARLQAASLALAAGEPLGEVPGAPPALARYAQAAPPTEAGLRLAFPAAARAAETASVEKLSGVSYWTRVKARLETLLTVTKGGRVLLGPPAAAITAQAATLLQAGDLAGAVAALGRLSAPTQAAMGDWLAQARALLAARDAIIAMAGQA